MAFDLESGRDHTRTLDDGFELTIVKFGLNIIRIEAGLHAGS
jgi:hypothetical protein